MAKLPTTTAHSPNIYGKFPRAAKGGTYMPHKSPALSSVTKRSVTDVGISKGLGSGKLNRGMK